MYYLCTCKNICKDFVIFASKLSCFSLKQVNELVFKNKTIKYMNKALKIVKRGLKEFNKNNIK